MFWDWGFCSYQQFVYISVCPLVTVTALRLLVPVVWHRAGQILFVLSSPLLAHLPTMPAASSVWAPWRRPRPITSTAVPSLSKTLVTSFERRELWENKRQPRFRRRLFDYLLKPCVLFLKCFLFSLFIVSFFPSCVSLSLSQAVYAGWCQSSDRTPDRRPEEEHRRCKLSFPLTASCR